MQRCTTCKFFKRGKWHKSIDPDESPQLGGQCSVLTEVLKMENSFMWGWDLYVQDTFGCVFHIPKRDNDN